MAEWLGGGLQNLLQRFESARRLYLRAVLLGAALLEGAPLGLRFKSVSPGAPETRLLGSYFIENCLPILSPYEKADC